MKKYRILLVMMLVSTSFLLAQNCEVISQYKKGLKLEYTHYNRRGKVKGVDKQEVLSVTTADDTMIIKIKTRPHDYEQDLVFNLGCSKGDFQVSLLNFFPIINKQTFNNTEEDGEGSFLVFPPNLKEGDTLPDAKILIGNNNLIPISITVKNRKIVEVGPLKVKAKTMQGYRTTYDYEFKIGFIKKRGKGEEWYANGLGVVKSMGYKRNGKFSWSKELTKITEPN